MIVDKVGERIRALRNELGLSQEEFAEKLKMQRSSISKIEQGQVPLTEKNQKLVCREFNANKEWMLTGKGQMFSDDYDAESIAAALNIVNDMDRKIILAYLRLDEKYRAALRELIKEVIGE